MRQRGMGMVGAIIAMVIAGVIVSGIIYYGPRILSGIKQDASDGSGGGALSVREVNEHPNKYYWQTITVEGQVAYVAASGFGTFLNENICNGALSQTVDGTGYGVMFDNAPASANITMGGTYRMTGVLKPLSTVPILDVKSVESA